MKIGDYSIRPIEERDLELLLNWRNSERIHSLMLTDHKITWEEHYQWFKKISEYEPKRNFIFEYKNKPIGYMGYTDYNEINKTCSPGLYIGETSLKLPDAGIVMAFIELEYAFKVLNMKSLISTVFAKNKRVYKLNMMLGYKVIDTQYCTKNNGLEKIFRIQLNDSVWEKKRNIILNMIN